MAKDTNSNKQLFKKILLSFFPKNQLMGAMNPTGMFVSFISTKQFFSLVNRKIVENYKLNLFDIALDPFEVKIGFGDSPGVGIKEIDPYYGYCSAANLNGYRLFSPGILATTLAMVASVYVEDKFSQKDAKFFIHFLFTIYLLAFVFTAGLKKFPQGDKESNYRRFVDLFFNFYEITLQKTKTRYTQKELETVKHLLLKEIELFMCLFYSYEHLSKVFDDKVPHDVYSWLFFDELKKAETKAIFEDFLKDSVFLTEQSHFSAEEKLMLDKVLPVDIIIRYLFLQDDELAVTRHIVSKIYNKEIVTEYMRSFLESDQQWQEFIEYITDFKVLRQNFFEGAQTFVRHKFRISSGYDPDVEEEINDFMSSVEDLESLEGVEVPEAIRKESDIMEKLLNFYVTFVGGMRIARGDNFYYRLFKRPLLNALITAENIIGHKQDNLYYFGAILYSYSKNIFYYKYAFDNIRAGKDKFMLPFKSKFKEVYSNMFIVKLLDENFVSTIMQDCNHEDIKIYTKTPAVIDRFRQKFGDKISSLMAMEKKDIVIAIYKPIQKIIGQELDFLGPLQTHISDDDVVRLKDHCYQLDFWYAQSLFAMMNTMEKKLLDTYSPMVIMGILATLRETFFGFALYMHYLQHTAKITENEIKNLCLIYFSDVVNMHEEFFDDMFVIYNKLQKQFTDYFHDRVLFDDNPSFFAIGHKNRKKFNEDHNQEILTNVSGEDIVWFRGYLKNITYYNKRYLIPGYTKS